MYSIRIKLHINTYFKPWMYSIHTKLYNHTITHVQAVNISHADDNHTAKFSGIKHLACCSSWHFSSTNILFHNIFFLPANSISRLARLFKNLNKATYPTTVQRIKYPIRSLRTLTRPRRSTCSTTPPSLSSLRRPFKRSNGPTPPASKDLKYPQTQNLLLDFWRYLFHSSIQFTPTLHLLERAPLCTTSRPLSQNSYSASMVHPLHNSYAST